MMWARFTERARKVIYYAQEEAQNLHKSQVSTEHLLLGLVRESDSSAAVVLGRMGIDSERIRQEVERSAPQGDAKPGPEVQLTPRAKRVIDHAFDEARLLKNDYIGTEHLLLGLIREGEGLAARVLTKLGALYTVTFETVKAFQGQSAGAAGEKIPEQPAPAPEQGDTSPLPRTDIGHSLGPELMRQLMAQALTTRSFAYAPYSRYEVGAAVLTDEDHIYSGCNVENASYGLSICAERVAIFNAVAGGKRHLKAAAVATRDGGTPCGACRQVLSEFADDPANCLIILVKSEQEYETCTLAELLPKPFDF